MKTLVHASVVVPRGGRILVVREDKEAHRGRLNLPGGHLEPGEAVLDCARRETREETGLEVEPTGLLGVYTGLLKDGIQSIRFVVRAAVVGGKEVAGDDVQETLWLPLEELCARPAEELVAPDLLRRILADLDAGVAHPLTALREP